ncbi:Nucleoside diphosphate kinase [Popillia japonica]|uniref:Nucleoside diphosphate kinase n=1 Tax=Popillia japonica TaxID=7064 RepID=A0AAW1ME87_POPJA
MTTQRERTFIMVKPDGVQRGLVGEIIKRFEQKGFKLVALKFVWPTEELLQKHYADLSTKPFFPGLVKYMSSGPVVPMVWEGLNSVKTGRVMLGATNPADSAPGTIRGDLCIQVGRNIVHGSDSVESANKEINLWFSEKEVVGWTPANEGWKESTQYHGNFHKVEDENKTLDQSATSINEKFSSVKILQDFQTIEQCSLEYDPTRGASIDPHIDDCWVWGERIVTVNLLADSILNETGSLRHDKKEFVVQYNTKPWPIVRIPLPRRSLFVMYGKARYEWEHQILREDIVEKRICLAYREFTPSFLEGGDNYKYGKPILDIAQKFF